MRPCHVPPHQRSRSLPFRQPQCVPPPGRSLPFHLRGILAAGRAARELVNSRQMPSEGRARTRSPSALLFHIHPFPATTPAFHAHGPLIHSHKCLPTSRPTTPTMPPPAAGRPRRPLRLRPAINVRTRHVATVANASHVVSCHEAPNNAVDVSAKADRASFLSIAISRRPAARSSSRSVAIPLARAQRL